jgi:hypothetical protein
LLHDGWCVAADLRDLDDDRFARYYAFSWFETYRTTLNLLGETLSLNDETIQTGGSRAIDETGLSTRRRKKHR